MEWKHEGSDPLILEDSPEGRAELTSSVVQNDLALFQEAPIRHGEVFGYLHHPSAIRVGGDTGYMDFPSGLMDEEKNIVGGQALRLPDLPSEEIGANERFPMDFGELGPRRAIFDSFRSGSKTVPFEDIADSGFTDDVAQGFQGIPDMFITPRGVFLGELDNQLFNLLGRGWSAWASFLGIVPLFPDGFPLPTQESGWGKEGENLLKGLSSHFGRRPSHFHFLFKGGSGPFGKVGQEKPELGFVEVHEGALFGIQKGG